jgi:hypothetical protein
MLPDPGSKYPKIICSSSRASSKPVAVVIIVQHSIQANHALYLRAGLLFVEVHGE